jgi:hypothetical protein
LKEFLADSPPFDELQPRSEEQERLVLSKPGAYYLVYCQKPGNATIELAGQQPYKLDRIDPWAMTIAPLGTAPAGPFELEAPRSDVVFRVTPYQAGERLRPFGRRGENHRLGDRRATAADGQVCRLGRRADSLGLWRRCDQRRAGTDACFQAARTVRGHAHRDRR